MKFSSSLVWVLGATLAHAEARTGYSLAPNLRVSLELPANWIAITDIPLVPLAILEVADDNARAPVFRLQPLSETMNLASLAEEQVSYRADRKTWAEVKHAQIKEFFELEKISASASEVLRTGIRYLFGNEDLLQRDYYLRCGKRWIHGEALYLASAAPQVETRLDRMVQGLRCE
ncbi:MAG: hypothetical protein JST16_04075 [Bdellovibrionales bacterium]|nr:hypothetical protein [Bdellovibrionales bacterium]